jgi:uncharacterized iron-regulated protein
MRLSLIALLLLGCAGSAPLAPAPPPLSTPKAVANEDPWQSTLDREHPLVGKIWDVKAARFVTADAMAARLATAPFVLLGERHDNRDHHRLQARVVQELVKDGRHPAVVFEMLEREQQPIIDRYVAEHPNGAANFGAALAWEKTSWPAYADYQPIFEAALAAKLPIKAGNLAHADAKALVKEGLSALPSERVQALGLDRSFPEALEASLVQELRASHCGKLPEKLLSPMALAQHARDSQLAQVLSEAGSTEGAVLIAGSGHARLDRGVPYYLAQGHVFSVAFREVQHEGREPERYVDDEGPFDYLWFTPRHSDDDPCKGL